MMNNILELKGTFTQRSRTASFGPPSLRRGGVVKSTQLQKNIIDLQTLYEYWVKDNLLDGALISIHYNKIAAKSNRMKELIYHKGKRANESIVGTKFSSDLTYHIITH